MSDLTRDAEYSRNWNFSSNTFLNEWICPVSMHRMREERIVSRGQIMWDHVYHNKDLFKKKMSCGKL